MKNFFKFVLPVALTSLLVLSSAQAQSSKPSPESLEKLFSLTNADSVFKTAQANTDTILKNMIQSSVGGKSVTAEQQKALDVFRAKVIKIQTDELNWEYMEPKMAEIYSNALTQEDVDGLIAFYQSPAGRAFVTKMPQIMQQTQLTMQSIIVPMMKKIDAAGVELKLDLQRIDQK